MLFDLKGCQGSLRMFWHLTVKRLVLDPPKTDLHASAVDTLCFRLCGSEWEWGSLEWEWIEGDRGSMRIECIMKSDCHSFEAKRQTSCSNMWFSDLFNWKNDALSSTADWLYVVLVYIFMCIVYLYFCIMACTGSHTILDWCMWSKFSFLGQVCSCRVVHVIICMLFQKIKLLIQAPICCV